MSAPFLDVKRLTKTYGGFAALDAVDFSINAGEVVCLAGSNGSGKSTLIKCISGVEPFDAGDVAFQGRLFPALTPNLAMEQGVQVIYQDLSLFPDLPVWENVCFQRIGGERRGWLVRRREGRVFAARQLERLGVRVDLNRKVEHLSMGQRQSVAIARALAQNARLLIMDEPTTALPAREVDMLLDIVKNLRSQGIAIIFVSHKLDELFAIADRITIIRDGLKVGDYNPADLDKDRLGFLMVGKSLDVSRVDADRTFAGVPALELEKLTKAPYFRDIDLRIHPGEVVGLTGLIGSGRTELALSLFGLNPPDAGVVRRGGKAVSIRSPREAIDAGVGLVSEDRQSQGLFLSHPIATNVTAAILKRLAGPMGLVSLAREMREGKKWCDDLKVRTGDITNPARSLSGGNQQKVVLAKWLATGPEVLILDSPTVGIDVGSKADIYEMIKRVTADGKAVLMISDEAEELERCCHRVLVMKEGRIDKEFAGSGMSQSMILSAVRGN